MRSLKSRLPPLSALLTFEAAARHLSFTLAAGELFVSQAAVSRQIRRLEEDLGVALFARRHRALELTPEGRRLEQAVRAGLTGIADAAADVAAAARRDQIQVATTVAFATYWFMPRLNAFRQHHPEVDVRVLASDRHQDHMTEAVDVALVCGRREAPGWHVERLFSEVVFPVCSPEYLERHPIERVADLPRHALLHLDERHWEDVGWAPVDWAVWLRNFGVDYRPHHPLVTFNNYPMLVEAAIAGDGIALGWRHLSQSLLAQGRLVRPLREEWDFERSYFLAVHEHTAASPEVHALRDWLRAGTEV